jgi:hypothetical protein
MASEFKHDSIPNQLRSLPKQLRNLIECPPNLAEPPPTFTDIPRSSPNGTDYTNRFDVKMESHFEKTMNEKSNKISVKIQFLLAGYYDARLGNRASSDALELAGATRAYAEAVAAKLDTAIPAHQEGISQSES